MENPRQMMGLKLRSALLMTKFGRLSSKLITMKRMRELQQQITVFDALAANPRVPPTNPAVGSPPASLDYEPSPSPPANLASIESSRRLFSSESKF